MNEKDKLLEIKSHSFEKKNHGCYLIGVKVPKMKFFIKDETIFMFERFYREIFRLKNKLYNLYQK